MKAVYPKHNLSDDDFIKILTQKIKERQPLSFTRFGDGEIYFINNNVPKLIEDQLKVTWGYDDMNLAKKNVLEIINQGLTDSDIIGLMDPNNDISKNMSFSYETWSIKKDYLNKIRSKPLLIADHMITRGPLLGDIYKFKEIIQSNDIAIISPRAELLKNNKLEEILGVNVNYVNVPMGMNLTDRSDIFKKLDSINELIVLYGCSINGKDFGSYLSNRGKIALDFGATLDAWSGLITRKWFGETGLQKHCLIKKK
jgi:hypothetical protein